MRKAFLSLLMVFVLFGCANNKVNNAKEKVSEGLSIVFSFGLDCKRKDLMKEDFMKLLHYEGEATEEKFVVSTICKLAVSQVVPSIFKVSIPKKYECTVDKIEAVATLASNACSFITI